MALANRVAQLPADYVQVNLGEEQISITIGEATAMLGVACHTATFIWTYWEAFGRIPLTAKVAEANTTKIDGGIGFTSLLTKMASHGTAAPLKRSFLKKLALTPGSVVVFVDGNGRAGHSCVAKTKYSVGGYNQTGWFSRQVGWLPGAMTKWKGAKHSYTEHPVGEFVWNFDGDEAQTSGGMYQVVQVPEATALKIVRDCIGE
jgi:hypothetical protein